MRIRLKSKLTSITIFLTVTLLCGISTSAQTNAAKQTNFANQKDFKAPNFVSPTVYHIHTINSEEQKCKTSELVQILDVTNTPIALVCPNDSYQCGLQGTCIINGLGYSVMLNFVANYRFSAVNTSKCPFGRGVQEICVDPFYSVAANLNQFPTGTVIYIPALKDLKLPNGKSHGGYLIVRDTGAAFNGTNPIRMDFFTGNLLAQDPNNPFTRLGFADPKSRFEFRVVTGATAQQFRASRNFPLIPESKISNP